MKGRCGIAICCLICSQTKLFAYYPALEINTLTSYRPLCSVDWLAMTTYTASDNSCDGRLETRLLPPPHHMHTDTITHPPTHPQPHPLSKSDGSCAIPNCVATADEEFCQCVVQNAGNEGLVNIDNPTPEPLSVLQTLRHQPRDHLEAKALSEQETFEKF